MVVLEKHGTIHPLYSVFHIYITQFDMVEILHVKDNTGYVTYSMLLFEIGQPMQSEFVSVFLKNLSHFFSGGGALFVRKVLQNMLIKSCMTDYIHRCHHSVRL